MKQIARALFAAATLFLSAANAQVYAPPNCGPGSADSTCYTTQAATSCPIAPKAVSQKKACPAPYAGKTDTPGSMNMCTGVVTWGIAPTLKGCTNCPNPMTADETTVLLASMADLSEAFNIEMFALYCGAGGCLDGSSIPDPLNPTSIIGRVFRDHIWVHPKGASGTDLGVANPALDPANAYDPYGSGLLLTQNRMQYLVDIGATPTLPPSDLYPLDDKGNPITNAGVLYDMGITAVTSSGTIACANNDADHCDMTCSTPSKGWGDGFCKTFPIAYDDCADAYKIYDGSTWQPTTDVTVPFTSSFVGGGFGDYAAKAWGWDAVLGWNGQPVATGGSVYICDANVRTCNGWVPDTSQPFSQIYQCRTPVTYDCSYVDAATGASVSATCTTCDPGMGAVWDYYIYQKNDCLPKAVVATRTSDTREGWMSDFLAAKPLCPIKGIPAPPPTPTCTGGQILDGSGTSCVCPPGQTWDGSMCKAPPPPPVGTPPTLTTIDIAVNNSAPTGDPSIAILSYPTANVTGVSVTSAIVAPPGTYLSYSGNRIALSGMPTVNPGALPATYTISISVSYANGFDSGGVAYPNGVATGTLTITVGAYAPATPPAAVGLPVNLSNGAATPASTTVALLNYATATATGFTLASGSLPPGTSLLASGNSIFITGTPSATGSYPITLSINYAGGTDGMGNPYAPGTTAVVSSTITVVNGPVTPGVPPTATGNSIQVSNGVSIGGGGAAIANLNYAGAVVTGATVSSGSLPTGLGLTWASNVLAVTGTPTVSAIYNVTLNISYAPGIDGSGNSYPAGTTTATATIEVVGCGSQAVSWSGGGSTCYGTLGLSATYGTPQSIGSTSASPSNAMGAATYSCTLANGTWTPTNTACSSVTPPLGGQDFYSGGLGLSPTGKGTKTSSSGGISGSWYSTGSDATGINIAYSWNVGSLIGVFSGSCRMDFGATDGSGNTALSGGCGSGLAGPPDGSGNGSVSVTLNAPDFTANFTGTWNVSGSASGPLAISVNSGKDFYALDEGGSVVGFVLMDGSGNFSGMSSNGSQTITGYLNGGSGVGAITKGSGYYALTKDSSQFATVSIGGTPYAVGGQMSNFFGVNSGGGIAATGSTIANVPTNDPSWVAVFTAQGTAVPAGFNAVLTIGGTGTRIPGVFNGSSYDFGSYIFTSP